MGFNVQALDNQDDDEDDEQDSDDDDLKINQKDSSLEMIQRMMALMLTSTWSTMSSWSS